MASIRTRAPAKLDLLEKPAKRVSQGGVRDEYIVRFLTCFKTLHKTQSF